LVKNCEMKQPVAEPCLFYRHEGKEFVAVIVWVGDTFWISYNYDIDKKLDKVYKSSESEGELLGMNVIETENGVW
jgi:hypothetical protein